LYCETHSADPDSRIHWDGATFTVTGQELPPDDAGNKTNHPMVEVSWFGAAAYSNWRSTQHGWQPCYDLSTWECDLTANGYRLPTEAEWEYAARGGEHNPYYKFPWGNDIDGSMANYVGSGDPYETDSPPTTPVGYYDGEQIPSGSDMANGYGLYDIVGNVYEWCNDWYDSVYYSSSPCANPQGPVDGTERVLRGGSCLGEVTLLRCAVRGPMVPGGAGGIQGFRLAAGT
jgi:formylglycine-generating enzyme required for sulfatase activity